jgi:GxxExxY protein
MNNIKQDIEQIKVVFFAICEEFGTEMKEKFYERQIFLKLSEKNSIKKQPFINRVRPDAIFEDRIILEYKYTKSANNKQSQYQVRKYLRLTNIPMVLVLDFKRKKVTEFY